MRFLPLISMLFGYVCLSASFPFIDIIIFHREMAKPRLAARLLTTHVLIVSIGAFENGPIAPEIKPIIKVCQLGKFPDSA
jgi:hypothetical protein